MMMMAVAAAAASAATITRAHRKRWGGTTRRGWRRGCARRSRSSAAAPAPCGAFSVSTPPRCFAEACAASYVAGRPDCHGAAALCVADSTGPRERGPHSGGTWLFARACGSAPPPLAHPRLHTVSPPRGSVRRVLLTFRSSPPPAACGAAAEPTLPSPQVSPAPGTTPPPSNSHPHT
jgi:hypothetical protein